MRCLGWRSSGLNHKKHVWKKHGPILEVISAHHDGLQSLDCLKFYLKQILTDPSDIVCPSGKIVALSDPAEYENAAQAFQRNFPDLRFFSIACRGSGIQSGAHAGQPDAALMSGGCGLHGFRFGKGPGLPEKSCGSPSLDAVQALDRLNAHRRSICQVSKTNRELSARRDQIFFQCSELDISHRTCLP